MDDNNMDITFPSSAKVNKKLASGLSNLEFDPWSTKPASELPTLLKTELKVSNPSEKETEIKWQGTMNEAILPINSNRDSFYESSSNFMENTEGLITDSTSPPNANLNFDWDKNLYFAPTTDLEAEFKDNQINNMIQAEKIFVQEKAITKTKSHPHQIKNFHWDNYLPEETLVFKLKDIPKIVETLVTNVNVNPSYETLLSPANGLFLYARYAHQIQSEALFNGLLNLAIHTIQNIVKNKTHDAIILSFWITNCNQLLYYLKRDHGLSVATIEQQVLLPEIIYDAYTFLILGVQDQLLRLLEKCMLQHDIIPGLEDLEFKDRKTSSKSHNRRRSKTRSLSPRQLPYSPRTITTVLASIHNVFETYLVHQSIVLRCFNQLFYFVATSLFNSILKSTTNCCRAKALQVRMNLSNLEEWARNQYPEVTHNNITLQFKPLIQLLELLQCVTRLKTLNSFLETITTFDTLTAIQIYIALNNYYYEVDEEPLNKEILNLVKSRAINYPNDKIPNNIKELNNNNKMNNNNNKMNIINIKNGIRNSYHMLPFGTPNQLEMDHWWSDYAPFLPMDLIHEINEDED
ncbi:hypothetical protein K502DRAFT_326278 [Neoconidiobolus thromboides FSU 785]|nr:hypothetical protein K502DRAFT_326278 [Neoconidiobolus thromboides FSU 785]